MVTSKVHGKLIFLRVMCKKDKEISCEKFFKHQNSFFFAHDIQIVGFSRNNFIVT
jgi:hypothetical protein